ncbi:armadillo-type protein [Syncephalastrum racemosum]|uniref:Armadillo-type protein n=1 Tax=Syncephalastrum racemosum TaxID=13706 RepID=A0A1X2HM17_SYNRA|nr:armadillo-type protein [Syncephalastrum racemosum]
MNSTASPSSSSSSPPRLLNRVSGFFMQKKPTGRESGGNQTTSSIPSVVMEEDAQSSRADSMFSSLSSIRPNPNSPPPLRTVRLDQPIVHESPSPITPPPSASPSKMRPEDVDAAFEQLMQEYALAANIRPSLTQLTTEQKSALLQSSQARTQRKSSTFSAATQFFSTLRGNKNSSNHYGTVAASSDMLANHQVTLPTDLFAASDAAEQKRRMIGAPKRSKHKSSPQYFVRLLNETPARALEDTDVSDLRIFLRNVVVSWTTEFLALGGYEAIGNVFRQMKHVPKRMPSDDKLLQQFAKCFKAIMTHEASGIEKVLTDPSPLVHVRDLLFGPADPKVKAVYGLDIVTRGQLLQLLCTLPSLQVTTRDGRYIHGYDVLCGLLLDKADDEEDEKKDTNYPFRMSLKADPQTVMKMIVKGGVAPRYTAWMREIQHTVDRHIEPITFLAQVLDYRFESAFRQLKSSPHQPPTKGDTLANGEPEGLVMVDEGVVDYLITHLRLIFTLVMTPPTQFQGEYDDYQQEKVRLEIMLSGFDKIAKALQQCPHPTLYASYVRYLQPLISPRADLTIPSMSSSASSTSTVDDLMARWNREMTLHQPQQQQGNDNASSSSSWQDTDDDDEDLENYDDIFDTDEASL